MSVYVDNARIPYRWMLMSHMLADTLEELHAMADAIGLSRKHFQELKTPHYDICQAKRHLAVQAGAIEADRKMMVRIIRYWRETGWQ